MRFRHLAGFGKRMEYYIIGLMLKEGLDCYVPLVDDDGIDVVIRRKDGSYIEVQIKARSKDVIFGDAALFAAIVHEPRNNYFFIFYSERMETMWIMSSMEPYVCEGTQWSLDIETEEKTIHKYGSNKYPRAWELLCNLIEEKTGGEFS